ncbi:MAG: PAS domain S-box protein [Rhodocyclales bacterium GT-UBC]|nr:MAG: PAS domain S-box protein [Rhodocyclales bacterium GT-UBC]
MASALNQLQESVRHSASVRAVLMLATVMILALTVASVALLADLRHRELEQAKAEIVSLSKILSEQTTRTIDGVSLAMRGARERLSDELGHSIELDSLLVHLLLKSRVGGLPQVKSMFVVDAEGFGVNSSRPDFIRRLSMLDREFYRFFVDNEHEDFYISHPEKARVDGQWTYYIAMRLVDQSGKFRGLLVSAIRIGYFESLYESIGADFVNRIQLLTLDGGLLAGTSRDQEQLGKTVADLKQIIHSNGQAMAGGMSAHDHPEEGRWYTAYRPVSTYPLIVSAAVREEEALRSWRRIAFPITLGVLVIILFILTITFLMVRNLLKKEQLEIDLRISDQQLRLMVQTVRDAIVTADITGKIILFNVAAEHLFGVKASEALGQKIGDFLAQCQPKALEQSLMRYFEEGWQSPTGLALLSLITLSRNGHDFPVELGLSTTTFRGNLLVTAVFRDLSERRQAELELMEKNRQLQELSASIQNVRERERARISRELHDELGQSLTGMRMEVSWLGSRLKNLEPTLSQKALAIKDLIDHTIASVRRISSELRPLVLDDLGFAAAANWYVDQFSKRTGLPVTLDLPEEDPQIGGALATALFRILQESLTNIARHAQASAVNITLTHQSGAWLMTIQDNGLGFDTTTQRGHGIGLIGMRERAQILGGTFSLSSSPTSGTRIEVRVPEEHEESHG